MTTRGVEIGWLSQGMDDVPRGTQWLSALEAKWAEGMRFEKRRSEFTLGRWTAKNAIARYLGRPLAPRDLGVIEIDRATDGAPAPRLNGRTAPVSISMTDRADQAVCVVGPSGLDLGVDLELVEARSDAFVADYLTASEQDLVGQAASREERDLRANLLWSAKESALKVLRTGLRRDTRSVEVTLADESAGEGWASLRVRPVEGDSFPGWWRRFGAFLLVVTARAALAPPRALVDPPGLASAIPAHGWMAATARSRPPGA